MGKPKEESKILNFLTLPAGPNDGLFPDHLATDLYALKQIDQAWSTHYPWHAMLWTIAGMTDALHVPHADANGLSTGITVKHGEKWWMIITPPRMKDRLARGIDSLSLDDPWLGDKAQWNVAVMRLTGGDSL
jgi:hypothetical protein